MGSTFDSWNNGGGDSGGTGGSGGASARDPSDSQDFAAVKLDADGTEVWRFHVRTRNLLRFAFLYFLGGRSRGLGEFFLFDYLFLR